MSEQPHAAHDEHGHHGSPFVQHHYDDAQHQFDSGKLGIWLFLAQEVLFFSALFVAYILYRHHHGEIWVYAHTYLDTKMGAINTAILIFSSLTAAWAVRAAQLRQQKLLVGCLAATLMCALGFLVIKYFEYTHKIHEHILFGKRFDPCISSNGTPLVTKNNECPGTKSNVKYDFSSNTATGCLPDVAIDQDPHTPLVQAKCKVLELTGPLKSVDKVGQLKIELASPDTPASKKPELEAQIKETEAKLANPDLPKAERAALSAKKEMFAETARKPIPDNLCFDGSYGPFGGLRPGSNGEPAESKFPCWKPSHQPAVCKVGWFYAWSCTGEKCEKPSSGGEGPFPSLEACDANKRGKVSTLGALGTAAVSDCSHGQAAGIVVDYDDHEERPDPELNESGTIIRVDCEGPPAIVNPDYFAEQEQKLAVGAPSTTAKHALTHHEEKEMIYSGPPPEHTNMFFTIYFAMTGLHGIHVLFGVFIFIWLLIRSVKGHFTPDYFGPVDFAALYWHIVDLIWIFLFPLMYLIH